MKKGVLFVLGLFLSVGVASAGGGLCEGVMSTNCAMACGYGGHSSYYNLACSWEWVILQPMI